MLCKNNNVSNNPVYMDTSEIRLPDGNYDKRRKSPIKIKRSTTLDYVIFGKNILS
jgi:hypothetical protein